MNLVKRLHEKFMNTQQKIEGCAIIYSVKRNMH